MAKTSGAVPADKLALYEKLVATNPHLERKGATVPYTSVNDHMFSFLTKCGLAQAEADHEQQEKIGSWEVARNTGRRRIPRLT